MKVRLLLIVLLVTTAYSRAQSVNIFESAGWFESAYIKWEKVVGAESYNVYYTGEGIINKKIDNQLIREYTDYFRADILGIAAGAYIFKVIPVIEDIEGEASETGPVNVNAHDRTGFAFMNGHIPGAYKANGTLKENAVILYITENTKNTISLNVNGANENPCVGLQMIMEGFKKGDDNRPLSVRFVGQITDLEYMDKGDIVIENENNASGSITFEGVGDDAVADGWGIRIKNATNIEIRNMGIMNTDSDEGDDIGLQQDNFYIWVHHCDFFYGAAGGDADQSKGDGALDSKKSGFITFSYNHFWDTGKSNLLGNGIEDPQYLTYHHNWYDHSDSRHPRVRSHSVHVYNNYYDGIAKYGIGSTNASSVFVEANYFRNCRYPMLISMQGSDVFDESSKTNNYSDMPTFSKEEGGIIKAYNNFMTGQRRFVSYGDIGFSNSTVDFDAVVVSGRQETIGSEVVSYLGGNAYNNFDTKESVMYAYTADSPEVARDKVIDLAGRINGGDFKWVFNNETDDASYDVNTGLQSALVNYQTSLISVQGDGEPYDPGDPGDTTNIDSSDVIHNFTLSGTTSTFYSISGNLSNSKGTVSYAGLTLTQCLKIESGTLISFATEKESTLTLVFNTDFSGQIKVNGISYSANAGILTLPLSAGSFDITKADVANLFFMIIDYGDDNTSLKPNPGIPEFLIYPNPVSNELYIFSGLTLERVDIFNLLGVLVIRTDANINTIDMSTLKNGSYLVKVICKEGIFDQIIIKK